MTAPRWRLSLFVGSISFGTNVGETSISILHGTSGGVSVAPSALQSGTSKRLVSVT